LAKNRKDLHLVRCYITATAHHFLRDPHERANARVKVEPTAMGADADDDNIPF
jgi:hypothetical protein